VKRISFLPNVPAEIRAIPQPVALGILMRLRVGDYRVLFDETADTVTLHRVRDRKNAYH
jgi:mRNA-degrading endonuclease RelE of RelBE toxin-antitoxin system